METTTGTTVSGIDGSNLASRERAKETCRELLAVALPMNIAAHTRHYKTKSIITITFPPITLFAETYRGIYAQLHFFPYGRAEVSLHQRRSEMPPQHPHFYSEEAYLGWCKSTNQICWSAFGRCSDLVQKKDYQMLLFTLHQAICTVTGHHWRRGLSVCAEPGCLTLIDREGLDYCLNHKKSCRVCNVLTGFKVRDGLCSDCRRVATCRDCREVLLAYELETVSGWSYCQDCLANCSDCNGRSRKRNLVGTGGLCPACIRKQQYESGNRDEAPDGAQGQPLVDYGRMARALANFSFNEAA